MVGRLPLPRPSFAGSVSSIGSRKGLGVVSVVYFVVIACSIGAARTIGDRTQSRVSSTIVRLWLKKLNILTME